MRIEDFLGTSVAAENVREAIATIAKDSITVLLTGETGTGKELVARIIHDASDRCHRPYVVANCAAIPEGLVESELFGHQKGSYTGAVSKEPGLFRSADQGTLLLDEIGDMDLGLQKRLLRSLNQPNSCEREVGMIGATKASTVNARVIASTNQDLEAMVAEGKFRSDLYFRVSSFPIHIPSLRERKEDIPLLARFFLKDRTVLSPDATGNLCRYSWPGNVRELQSVLEKALRIAKRSGSESILPEHLHFANISLPGVFAEALSAELRDIIFGDIPIPPGFSLKESRQPMMALAERCIIGKALQQANNNGKRAAELLGVNYRTFVYMRVRSGLGMHRRDDQALARGAGKA
jgi:transcriptional regulator with GAF, ATPase, and Fis domain